ncbi:MAG: hypothetical protein J5691_00200 [Bacilli bacterium]|nr:hypothetical protein [Bacilli bacterium]
MAIPPQPFIKSAISETSTILINDDARPIYTVSLEPENNPWLRSTTSKQINLNKVDDCYYLLYKAIINNVSSDLAEKYKTLLKINKDDYKLTVLQIETSGEEI